MINDSNNTAMKTMGPCEPKFRYHCESITIIERRIRAYLEMVYWEKYLAEMKMNKKERVEINVILMENKSMARPMLIKVPLNPTRIQTIDIKRIK